MFQLTTVLAALLVLATTTGELVDETGSLYHNYVGSYAPTYKNYEPRPYSFEYGVSDPHTGDHKSQWETKDKAGVVRGGYSLLEPDGTTRIVEYLADHDGFRAVVKKLGASLHPHHGQSQISVEHHGGPITPGYHAYDGNVANYVQAIPQEPIYQIPQQPIQHYEEPIFQQQYEEPSAIQHYEEPAIQHYEEPIKQQVVYPSYQAPVLAPEAPGLHQPSLQPELLGSYHQNVLVPQAQGLHSLQGLNQSPQPQNIFLGEGHQISHPYYGESSSNYQGTTGNLEDDHQYTNYEQGGYAQPQHLIPQYHRTIKTLPYNYIVSHPILH